MCQENSISAHRFEITPNEANTLHCLLPKVHKYIENIIKYTARRHLTEDSTTNSILELVFSIPTNLTSICGNVNIGTRLQSTQKKDCFIVIK